MKGFLYKTRIILSLLLVCVVVTLFASCAKRNGPSTIKTANLSREQEQLIKVLSDSVYFAYDLDIRDLDVNWMDYWVEYYEDGSVRNNIVESGSQYNVGKKDYDTILFTRENSPVDKNKIIWTAAHISGDEFGRGSTVETKTNNNPASTWTSIDSVNVDAGKPVVLGIIVEGENPRTPSIDEVNKNETALEELSKENSIYVIKCMFSKK